MYFDKENNYTSKFLFVSPQLIARDMCKWVESKWKEKEL